MNISRCKLNTKVTITALLLVLMLTLSAVSFGAEETGQYFRTDGSKTGYEAPGNLRLLTGEEGDNYRFRAMSSRYGFPEDYQANTTGFSTLNISGSSQYSAEQFHWLADKIREIAPGKDVYIIDLRQESHGFVDGTATQDGEPVDCKGLPLSWYGEHNWANFGMTASEVLADEESRFQATVGQEISIKGRLSGGGSGSGSGSGSGGRPGSGGGSGGSDRRQRTIPVQVTAYTTEKKLAEAQGFHYLRLAIPDRTFPEPDVLDTFIDLVQGIDMDNSWLHFHCMAGLGRTGIMMSVYDMMKNPDVPMLDILARQTMTGGSYPLSEGHSEDHLSSYDETRLRMVPLIYQYIQENHEANYPISWSEWLKQQEAEPIPATAVVP